MPFHAHTSKLPDGKTAPEWQTYLASKADPHTPESNGAPTKKEDHSTAGAVFTHGLAPYGSLLSYLIAGHHAGLPNGTPDPFRPDARNPRSSPLR